MIVSLGLPHFFYSTNADMKAYLKLFMMPRAKDKEIDGLLVHHPDDQRAGSPSTRESGMDLVWSLPIDAAGAEPRLIGPQFKRTAALQADFVLHGPRRFFLKHRAKKQNSWGFHMSRSSTQARAVSC